MSMDSLVRLMPVPSKPREVPRAEDLRQAEAKLGPLPEDYKRFLSAFGTGQIDDFLWIFNPAASSKHLNLLHQAPLQLSVLKEIKKQAEPSVLEQYPSSLLPFGKSDNGNILFWISVGEPSGWKVLVHDSRAPQVETFDLDMTSFLTQVLSQKVRCSLFPDDFPSDSPAFSSGP